MPRLKLVFDLDDTLYPERQFALSGFRAAARWAKAELGVDGLDEDMTRLLDAGHLGRLFRMVLAERVPDHKPEHAEALITAYREAVPEPGELALFADAAAALDRYGAGRRLGLITDGTHTVQRKKVAALALEPRFAHIVFTDALGPDRAFFKPHPMAYEHMERVLDRRHDDHMVYVGDNIAKDFVAPNAMGWTTIYINRPEVAAIHRGVAVAAGGEPQHEVASLDELPRILGV